MFNSYANVDALAYKREYDMNRLIVAICLTAIHASVIAAEPTSLRLSTDGLGNFRFGMTLDEINTYLVQKLLPTKPELRATENCDYLRVADFAGISFVFIDSRLKRIDVDAPGIKSLQGIEVGERFVDAAPALSTAKTEPLDHVPEGYAIVIEAPGLPNAMGFHFESDRVVRIVAGDKRVIRYSEGCD